MPSVPCSRATSGPRGSTRPDGDSGGPSLLAPTTAERAAPWTVRFRGAVLTFTLLLVAWASNAAAQGPDSATVLEPGAYDFSRTPLWDTEVEVRGIIRPGTPEADTGFVYMRVEDFFSEQEPAVRITWLPVASDLANFDLILMDPSSYAVRYRMEPREAGAYGIYWYGGDSAYAAQVDSLGHGRRDETSLERPVFSVPSLPWVLAQLSSRVDEPFRIEVPGFRPDDGGRVRSWLVTPGERRRWTLPEGGGSYPVREMTVTLEGGQRWRYLVSRAQPYLLGITGWSAEGTETFRFEVLDWVAPALDRSRRIPLISRQDFIQRD